MTDTKTTIAPYNIDLEEFYQHLDYFADIDKQDLSNIRILLNGTTRQLTDEAVDEFKFTGLSNKSVIDLVFAKYLEREPLVGEVEKEESFSMDAPKTTTKDQ